MTFTTDTTDTTDTATTTHRAAGVPADIPEHDYAVPLGTFPTHWVTGRPDSTAIHFYCRNIT